MPNVQHNQFLSDTSFWSSQINKLAKLGRDERHGSQVLFLGGGGCFHFNPNNRFLSATVEKDSDLNPTSLVLSKQLASCPKNFPDKCGLLSSPVPALHYISFPLIICFSFDSKYTRTPLFTCSCIL